MESIEWDGQPVKRPCSNCGSDKWYQMRTIMEGTNPYDWCSDCEQPVSIGGVPDAFLPRAGMTFQALCDNQGKPIPVQSKRHKQQLMAERGLRECPERLSGKTWVEGSRQYRKRNFEQARPKIREAYRQYLDNKRRGQ